MNPSDISSAPAERQREIIERVWSERNPEPPCDVYYPLIEYRSGWKRRKLRLLRMLDCGAFESAVIAMVPEGCAWHAEWHPEFPKAYFRIFDEAGDEVIGKGQGRTPALALLAAILASDEGRT